MGDNMNIKSIHGFGNHLIIDGFNSKKLDDKELIKKVLLELPEIMGMKIISEPVVVEHKAEKEEESGITGVVLIAESHVSIHTYPKKEYVTIDVFSCKEFDVDKAVEYLKECFDMGKVEKQFMKRGFDEDFDADKHFDQIKGISIAKDMKVKELMEQYKGIGFNATYLGKSVDIINKMKNEKATIFLSFTSNMVSSGLREIFVFLLKNKMVDVVITSIGSIEEDLIKTKKPFLLGDFNLDDKDLHRKGINRIGNILVPNDRYELLEDLLMPFFKEMYERQKKENKLVSPSELIFELGKTVNDENSIIYWATKNNIPIFCPAPTDGAFGLQLHFFKQNNKDFGIDVSGDMKQLADLVLNANKTGGIILGGGFAKHHTIGVNILREGLDYAVYITTATQYDGSLSGARSNEAKSWSKIKEEANSVTIEGDATIIFPLIVASVV
jgi:deoxyhypusine synthase